MPGVKTRKNTVSVNIATTERLCRSSAIPLLMALFCSFQFNVFS